MCLFFTSMFPVDGVCKAQKRDRLCVRDCFQDFFNGRDVYFTKIKKIKIFGCLLLFKN